MQESNSSATLTVTEAAALLRVSRGTAYEAIRTGVFPVAVLRVGRRILVPKAALLAVLGVQEQGA